MITFLAFFWLHSDHNEFHGVLAIVNAKLLKII